MTSTWAKFVLEHFPQLIKTFYTCMELEGSKITERKIVRF